MSRLDKYRKAYDKSKADKARDPGRLHRQIATEAARRLETILAEGESGPDLRVATQADLHAAKLQAVAVLGLVVRPGELPPDALVLELFEEAREEARATEKPEEPTTPVTADLPAGSVYASRFEHFLSLLMMLERVKQDPKTHPEGDALYHSLQVFDYVRKRAPYDEELLTAALLHDVGKATDPFGENKYLASVKALRGRITARTARLIERLPAAKSQLAGSLGYRARRALDRDEDSEALALLAEADREGRKSGVEVPTAEEAVEALRDLSDDLASDFEVELDSE
jgi:hypothetical protein